MDNSTLTSFHKEISQIKEYIKHVNYTDELASLNIPTLSVLSENEDFTVLLSKINDLQKHYAEGLGRDKRIFVYKAIIISLYGILEKYIEVWIKDYLSILPSIIPYNDLSEKFRDGHFTLSMKLIDLVIDGKWDKYQHLTKEVVLERLHHCIQNPNSYSFNEDAFLIQSGNLRHKRICEIFKHLELDLNDFLIKDEELNNEIGISQDRIANTEKDILYSKVNELVARRNTIAHGSTIDDILDNTAILPFINFINRYCKAIFKVLQQTLLKFELEHKFFPIEIVHNVWHNEIVGFRVKNYIIEVGQEVIVEKSDGQLYKIPIIELQKDNVSYNELIILEEVDIAFKIDLRVNSRCKFFLGKRNITN